MTTPRARADIALLEKLVLGQLPVDEVERLAVEYADDSRLVELAESLANRDDTLLDSLRNHQTLVDPEADRLVDRLVQRLKISAVPTGSPGETLDQSADVLAGQNPIPERLEYFRIQKVLGEGGMGTVYLADDTRLGRQVAVKTLKRELAANPSAKDRFLPEARSAARLEHDHIIPIYYVGEANGIPFLAMPFLRGEPLDRRIQRATESGQMLPIAEAIRIAREIASGLAVAHSQGLIHRDIKPANIWLEAPTGRVKILDFGLARSQHEDAHLTASGAIVGTPAYMAPEQARGLPIDDRADLFSLGCVLYLMLTGKKPFTGSDKMEILTSLALDTPKAPREINPHCPPALSQLTMQLLEKQPDQRPVSAKVIVDALQKMESPTVVATAVVVAANPWADIDANDDKEQPAQPTGPKTSPKTKPRKRRPLAFVTVGLLLAFVGFGVLFGGTIYRFVTNQGELVIEVIDNDVEVKIVQNGLVVQDKTSKREFTLAAGNGEIEVLEKDGLKLATKQFELTRNGKTTVKVTLQELADGRKSNKPAPNVPGSPSDIDRRAAEYVLSIRGTVRVNEQDRDIKAASDLPREPLRLLHVDLYENKQVGDAGLAAFKDCKNLQQLSLAGTQVGDAGLAHFKNCKDLLHLNLGRTTVGDAGLAHFEGCDNLMDLCLDSTKVGDAGLVNFKNCKNLATLCLNGTQVGDAGLANFKNCKNLRFLWLHDMKVGDEGLANFKDCQNLERLGLARTKVSDAGLAHFKDYKTLAEIDLNGTQVSDVGLTHFEGCKNLRCLWLYKTKVTAAGIDELKKALPQCKIEWDGGVIEPK